MREVRVSGQLLGGCLVDVLVYAASLYGQLLYLQYLQRLPVDVVVLLQTLLHLLYGVRQRVLYEGLDSAG